MRAGVGAGARSEGIHRIEGQVLGENRVMLRMCRELGFSITPDPEGADIQRVLLQLD